MSTFDATRALELADGLGTWLEMCDMLRAAVAEVERWKEESAGWRESEGVCNRLYNEVSSERDRLAAENATYLEQSKWAAGELLRERAENEKLRGALTTLAELDLAHMRELRLARAVVEQARHVIFQDFTREEPECEALRDRLRAYDEARMQALVDATETAGLYDEEET